MVLTISEANGTSEITFRDLISKSKPWNDTIKEVIDSNPFYKNALEYNFDYRESPVNMKFGAQCQNCRYLQISENAIAVIFNCCASNRYPIVILDAKYQRYHALAEISKSGLNKDTVFDLIVSEIFSKDGKLLYRLDFMSIDSEHSIEMKLFFVGPDLCCYYRDSIVYYADFPWIAPINSGSSLQKYIEQSFTMSGLASQEDFNNTSPIRCLYLRKK